ncbi:transcriptional antiterminator [Robertmurraya siralis]|uniref:Transcriptional antiterminator n=1 Tax=Robertmurraya siralis TaxID=77777 RepID=A0A919WKA9_9BACI|nr:sigma-54-dependent transcriptional regulator [Robertmurraya siralis]GIN63641.1 transcriptional antiterminator [Robertmurraya siralis]
MKNEMVRYMEVATSDFSFKKGVRLEAYQTEVIAGHFDIDRTRASRILNDLTKEHILIKINTRPVCFFHRETLEKQYGQIKKSIYESLDAFEKEISSDKSEEIFKRLIGYEKSLKEPIEQVKTAVLYPDNGLPLLFLGPTGVGKTFLARILYDYSRAKKVIEDHAPFYVFNCAQYANNPELLSSYLFGHAKGAFTGALKDQIGLIEQAHNGILFLDEVHRLNKEGQEKLFTFMDQGIFTRLGETSVVRKSKVRLVFATTESLSVFLDTFIRRIPITVNVPSLDERGQDEKNQFIHHFFMEESKLLGFPIEVTNKTLDILNKYHYTGNIGECKNMIKYACGFAYSKKSSTTDKIHVTLKDLPKDIYKKSPQLFNHYAAREGSILFSPDSKPFNYVHEMKISLIEQTFQNCLNYYQKFANQIWNESVLIDKCTDEITAMMDKLIFERPNESKNLMMEFTLSTVQDIFRYLEVNYNVKYDGNSVYTLSSYLFFKSIPFQLTKQEQHISELMLQFIKEYYKTEHSIVTKLMFIIEKRLDINLYMEDIILMTLFFCKAKIKNFNNRVKAMIVAHGYATASSIANVCNRLLGINVFDSIDMPVDATVRDITKKMLQYMEEQDTTSGLVVLVDMGSLSLIHEHIKDAIDGPLLFIDQVSTPVALEIGNHLIQGKSVEEIISPIKEFVQPNINLYYPTKGREYAIITSCFTGIGTATQIQELLSESIEDLLEIKVVAHDYDRLRKYGKAEAPLRIYDVLAIVGTANPEIEGINFISLQDIISGEGEDDVFRIFGKIADAETIRQVNDRIIMNFSLSRVIDSLTILDTEKIIRKVEVGIIQLEKLMGQKLPNDKKIALFVHVSCMIERLIRKAPITEYPNMSEFESNHTDEILLIKNAFSVLEENYSVKMTLAEIGYIFNIIQSNLLERKKLI